MKNRSTHFPPVQQMALNAYLILKGQQQGLISGSVMEPGKAGTILVIAASHELLSPRDPASGLPTGKRLHKPFVITKALDRSTPLLYRALVNNENLVEWELQVWRPSPTADGSAEQFYTVRLSNANISEIHFTLPNTQQPDQATLPACETIAFTYQTIEWLWTDGTIATTDEWTGPDT